MNIELKRGKTKNWLFWWSLNGQRWFLINSKNVLLTPNPGPDPFEAYGPYRGVINRVYQGFTETFEGTYDKASGKMSVRVLNVPTTAVISRMG